ncbi:trimeric porin PorB [Paludibacterium sp. THUN1379]|uniref:porin n=1 Tax=Paludibacterium sp. THUN1379 TaxID=3112107 RepID=UPI00308A0618|nr:trimeric porin PorB [Paludibacterium sp. THUN1379]
MNKKLIAVALAALPVAAMADVTIYGDLSVAVQHDSVTNQASQNRVQDTTSKVGFKGTEDLGNGLKTVWQVETRAHADGTGSDGFASRQTFVGLDGGNLGLIRVGYINNFQNDLGAVDQWQYNSNYGYGSSTANGNASLSGANGLGIFTNTGARLKNAIRYDSATFAGFNFGLVYSAGENAVQNQRADGTTSSSNIWGAGLNYTYGPVAAHYAYQQESNPSNVVGSTGNHSASKHYVEVDYNQDNLFVGLAYASSTGYDWQDGFAGDNGGFDITKKWNGNVVGATGNNSVQAQLKSRQAALSASYAFGAIVPKITYAKGWDQSANGSSVNNSGYTQYVLGVDYLLSKRTTAGLSYGRVNFDKNTTLAQGWNSGSDLTVKTLAFTLQHNF